MRTKILLLCICLLLIIFTAYSVFARGGGDRGTGPRAATGHMPGSGPAVDSGGVNGNRFGGGLPGEFRPSGFDTWGKNAPLGDRNLQRFLDSPADREKPGRTARATGDRVDAGRTATQAAVARNGARQANLDRGPQRIAVDRRAALNKSLASRGDHIRQRFDVEHPHWDFWKQHPDWARWRWTKPYTWATWNGLDNWFGWAVNLPYIDYLYGDNLWYEDDTVYYDDEQIATATEYAEQADQLAKAGGEVVSSMPDNTKWMSLGVFALLHQEKGTPVIFLQLSVDNDGVIAGTYYNQISGVSKSVQGLVDNKTQRAAWYAEDKPETVFETGIYNLTKNQTKILIHFGTSRTQTWLLVRLKEPAEAGPVQDGSRPERNAGD